MSAAQEEITDMNRNKSRNYAILAAFIILIGKLSAYIILSSYRTNPSQLNTLLNLQSILICWISPIFIVLKIEKRELYTIGFGLGKWSVYVYAFLILISILLPMIYLGFGISLIIQVAEQILFIAFAEEVLWRGYFQCRLTDWLGLHWGIILASVIFGLGHIISIYAIGGYLDPLPSISIMVQTTVGGLIFGYLLNWSKSIWPGALLHLFGNVFLFRII